MHSNWDYVKKTTLWSYEDLIKKLNVLTSYPVLWQAYNHDMTQASNFIHRLFPESGVGTGEFPARVLSIIERFKTIGITDWNHLLTKVHTRAECDAFIRRYDLVFEEFIQVLNYLLRWAFPFETASRELLAPQSPQEMSCYPSLKEHGLKNGFDILEQGCTPAGRRALVDRTGIPLLLMTRLVHRADIARLPYTRRKTILPLCAAGYDNLLKIASADLAQMDSDMESYYARTQGKSWQDYKAVIVLKHLVTCARAVPVIYNE
jgi:hypothetical protein